MDKQCLFGVPAPSRFEAPSAWLPRVALSQAESPSRIARLLGIGDEGDVDLLFSHVDSASLAALCGISDELLEETSQMLWNADELRLCNPILLTEEGQPRYRFCADCLKESSAPYFPVFWRVDAYRVCGIHKCLLEDVCPHCGAAVCPMQDWRKAGKDSQGVLMPSQCLACSQWLWKVTPIKLTSIRRSRISFENKMRLLHGELLINALVTNSWEGPAWITPEQLDGLDFFQRIELFEQGGGFVSGSFLSSSFFRRRKWVRDSQEIEPQAAKVAGLRRKIERKRFLALNPIRCFF